MKYTAKAKSRIFSIAWDIVRQTKENFSTALRKAWKVAKLMIAMRIRPTEFAFVKANGEIRFAVGKLAKSYRRTKDLNSLVFRFWDVEANGWRSFRADRIIF